MTSGNGFTYADMADWLAARGVTEVQCLVPDQAGIARGKTIPRAHMHAQSVMTMPETVLGTTLTGMLPQDDAAYQRAISPTGPGMLLRPDPATVAPVPWVSDLTAQVVHDCCFADGSLVDFAPRSVLRRILGLYAERGWTVKARLSIAFYLTLPGAGPERLPAAPFGRSGRRASGHQMYSIDAVNEFDPVFETVYAYSEQMALDADTLIQERGSGQFAMDFLDGEPLAAADHLFYFKRLLREAARRHGMAATFMAKLWSDEPGSAMVVEHSVCAADGAPAPAPDHAIGGLQRYLPAAMALAAPSVNSFRRIACQSGAPRLLRTADQIGTCLIGADANPYLALSATLACAYLGLTGQLAPLAPEEVARGALPRDLPAAVALLRAATALRVVLGERFVDVYAAVKELEYSDFMAAVSPWEREHLLLHV